MIPLGWWMLLLAILVGAILLNRSGRRSSRSADWYDDESDSEEADVRWSETPAPSSPSGSTSGFWSFLGFLIVILVLALCVIGILQFGTNALKELGFGTTSYETTFPKNEFMVLNPGETKYLDTPLGIDKYRTSPDVLIFLQGEEQIDMEQVGETQIDGGQANVSPTYFLEGLDPDEINNGWFRQKDARSWRFVDSQFMSRHVRRIWFYNSHPTLQMRLMVVVWEKR